MDGVVSAAWMGYESRKDWGKIGAKRGIDDQKIRVIECGPW